MRIRLFVCLLSFVHATLLFASQQKSGPTADISSAKVQRIVENLTIDEKIKLLTGVGFSFGPPLSGTDNFIPGVAGYTWSMPDHGLPSLLLADGPAGIRFATAKPLGDESNAATAFPIASLLAATWSKDTVKQVGIAIGKEARSFDIDVMLGPGMNLQRNPLGGRNYEYYSEDPYLSGKTAASMVKGIQSQNVAATIKHFVANSQETHRTALDTLVDKRTLHELYLRGFEIAIKEAKPALVMTAYNLLNGTHTSQSEWLNKNLLRDKWGHTGMVVTDWVSGTNAAEQVKAGHNLIMPGSDNDRASIKQALENGKLNEAEIDALIAPIIALIERKKARKSLDFDAGDHTVISRNAAAEGAVLLKNTSAVLPISTISKLAVFGVGAYDTIIGGTGSGDVAEAYKVEIAQGLVNAGITIDTDVATPLKAHIQEFNANLPPRTSIFDPVPRVPELALSESQIIKAAQNNAAAIVTISRLAGEFSDRPIADNYQLTAVEKSQLETIASVFGKANKPVIVILNVAGQIEMDSWQQLADAILVAWHGGQEAGNAVADVLTGKVNPSGHLPMTWHSEYKQVASADNFPGQPTTDKPVPAYGGFSQALPSEVRYQEGIYIGYRHMDKAKLKPAYPFGHGLSYTEFAFAPSKPKVTKDTLEVSVKVKNTGVRSGKDVVQIYVSAPKGALDKPLKELRGFAKTRLIKPQSTDTLLFAIPLSQLASFNAEINKWQVDAGHYTLHVAASADDIRSSQSFTLDESIVFE